MNNCLNRGWIDILERQVTYLPGNNAEFGPLIPLEPARIAGILSDDSLWDYDAIGGAPSRFFIRMNERGRTEFREDGKRRGLFRS